ncbi:oxygenase MpaB family protein [Streptomyces sp. NPDC048256]|uniref:oxygenase MpaB family protein n=1 Tax=unclassified Streptomyces TaxID=2593676 RepID=UPI0033D3C515
MTWQLHGDPMMWVAGVRALYLQALHPRAVRAVTQNSDFRRDARGRLTRTADFRRRVAHLAYASLPPYAHRLYGRRAPKPATVTGELRAMGTLLRCVPARARWQLPPEHVLRAMARLGPEARPAPCKVGR